MSNKVIIKTASTSLIIILIGLLGTAAFWLKINSDKLRESRELSEQLAGNYEALTDTVRAYRFRVDKLTTLNAAIAYRASVEVKEWQEKNKQDAELIKKMGVKIKDLQSVTNTTLVTTDTVRVDSIVYLQGKSTYRFISEFMKADVSINYQQPDSSKLAYEYRNDLILTNEFQQKRFLFFKIGKKFKTAHIVSKDKNCKITNFEYKEMVN